MNPLIKKEIRLLLPSFLIACGLALANLFVPQNTEGFNRMLAFPYVFCPAVTMMMALSSFGAEVSSGNFSSLLAQPVPRQKIWQTKILVLAISILIIGALYSATVVLRAEMIHHALVFSGWLSLLANVLMGVTVFGLAIFSGGLWTVLLLRQVAAAFWITVLVPGVIVVSIAAVFGDQPDEVIEGAGVLALGIYSLCGLFFARWLFFRAQDTQWTGGAVVMPELRGLRWWGKSGATAAGSSAASPHRNRRPLTALFFKELQLHQTQFLIAGVLLLLHLGAIATRNFAHFRRNSDAQFILESFWGLWLLMPLLLGCAAVAEERKNGTHEGQLCLPVKRRGQLIIKALVVLALSIFFGALMPLLLETSKVLPDSAFGSLAAISAGVAGISFYVSTLTRNTLQAIGPAVVGFLLAAALYHQTPPPNGYVISLWQGQLMHLIGEWGLLIALVGLTCWNYERVLVGWNVWRRNLVTLVLALAFVIAATTALYYRVWELLMPLEPSHGSARLTRLHPRALQVGFANFTLVLPDGRVWLDRDVGFRQDWSAAKIVLGNGRFLAGTNWSSVSGDGRDVVGIQRDGSLWVSARPEPEVVPWDAAKRPAPVSSNLVRFGSDHDWKAVAGRWPVFLLKANGSLWFWGTNRWNTAPGWPGLRAFEPMQLGTNSDWADIFTMNHRIFFRKTNGQVWTYPSFSGDDSKLELDHNITLDRMAWLETNQWRGFAWGWSKRGSGFDLAIGDDGKFEERAAWRPFVKARQSLSYAMVPVDAQIGSETNWLAVVTGGIVTVTLKSDGSLWQWTFKGEPALNPRSASAVRLGTHSDWVAIGDLNHSLVSLAADGSLWWWQFEPNYVFRDGSTPTLLMPSRRPEFLGNIFGKGY